MSDKSALVTGASSGIGEALARAIAARGFDLVLVARRERALSKLSSELAVRHSVKCDVVAADLTEPKGLDEVADRIRERAFTTVVNNAGYGSVGFFHELPLAEELGEIQLNVSTPRIQRQRRSSGRSRKRCTRRSCRRAST